MKRNIFVFSLFAGGLVLNGGNAQAEPLDVFQELQSQRTQVCRDIQSGDAEDLIDHLKETDDFLKNEAEDANDGGRMQRRYKILQRKLQKIYDAKQIRNLQINRIIEVYLTAVADLRVLYRTEIRAARAGRRTSDADFFENRCSKLLAEA